MIQRDDIIKHRQLCDEEGVETLQSGMNYRLKHGYSVLLMSKRANAPYADEVEGDSGTIIYEGHDAKKNTVKDPKAADQPLYTPKGTITQNGRFYEAAEEYKSGKRGPELVRIYEKIRQGVWTYNGEFHLVDAWQTSSNGRKVFKFKLQLIKDGQGINIGNKFVGELPHTRLIPGDVKRAVWERDKGKCVICGSDKNLHYDHILPFSKGGTSLNAANIQLLCQSCNLTKSDNIE